MTFLPDTAIAAAQQLAGIVHGDGGPQEVRALLAQVSTCRCACTGCQDGLTALAVTLAAMVDVDRVPTELLAWADPRGHRSQRHADLAVVDDLAIERACRGEHVHLTQRERKLAVHRLCTQQGMEPGAAAYRLNMSTARVRQILVELSTAESTTARCGHNPASRHPVDAPSSQTDRQEAS
ncbi:MAG TPA: hypothetical protein VFJ19_09520 [Nocardioidaceae bacterium]|nr:hypothetical protein [Nocardioidaceae bacterium]